MFNLLIFGSPGAGKGTQAARIAKDFNLTHLSSGELLRRERENGALGEKIKKYQDAGALVPDNVIIKIVEATVTMAPETGGFVFDGYPRNLHQARALDKFLKSSGNELLVVLSLKLSSKEAVRRVLSRSLSSDRSDDNHKTVLNRFLVYREQAKPLLDYYKKQGKLVTIDGRPDIAAVYKQMRAILKSKEKEERS